MSQRESYIPNWMVDEQGSDGWEWRMVWLLRNLAGDYAIKATTHEDFRYRAFAQARELLLDKIADRIITELPEIKDTTSSEAKN